MNWTIATDQQLIIITTYEYDCSPSLLRGAVIEMLNRGLFDRIIAKCVHTFVNLEMMERLHKISVEDFMQIGRIEVLKGLEEFDPSRGKNFMSFVFMKVKSQLIKEVTALSTIKRDCSNVMSYHQEMDQGNTFEQFLPDHKTNVEKYVVNKVTVEQLIKRLNKHQKKVILYRLQGYTFKEISEIFGRGTDRNMHQSYMRAIEKMRKGA